MIKAIGGALVALALTMSSALAGPYLFELMEIKSYRAGWLAMLDGQSVPDWIIDFTNTSNGVATPSEDVEVDGGSAYVYATVCKPHDCGDNMLHVLFAPEGRQAWAVLVTPGGEEWFGNPDAAVKQVLEAKLD
jgi:hypothetical protein